ncbi:MAG: 30S ribosome-binding factor RbfA [Chloroflexota bacterium]
MDFRFWILEPDQIQNPKSKIQNQMSKIRQRRTAAHVQTILSELFRRDLRDPRLHDVTITEVRIDRELQYADIYVHALGDEERKAEVMAGLTNAAGFLRRELAGRLSLRTVPQLHFHWDATLLQADQISRLLDNLEIPAGSEEAM